MSGSSAWIFRIASCPLRAVPTTWKSGEPAMISPMTRRMNALSSTTSTDAGPLEDTTALREGRDVHAPGGEMEVAAAPVVDPRILGEELDSRGGERLPRREHVA